MTSLTFMALHYLALLLFAVSCWGWGDLAVGKLLRTAPTTRWLRIALCICVGIGITICALQLLGVSGLLRAPWLIMVLALGWAAAARSVVQFWREAGQRDPRAAIVCLPHWSASLLIFLALGTTLAPLAPPVMWDELSFHLPHARQWAESGRLEVTEWLRYPWAPLNYHLLYAGALVLYDDVLPHLLHALAGWLTLLLLYQLGLRHASRIVATIAAAGWLVLSRYDYANAYVDMAVTMFVLAGWITFTIWFEQEQEREDRDRRGWLFIAAFSLGTAAGAKYQALGFLPFFAIAVLLRDRRLSTILPAVAFGLLPSAWWYLRNVVLTGDPFNPLGARIFGFHDWSAADLEFQLNDIGYVVGWPHPLLWAAALAPLFAATWRNTGLRLAM